MPPVLIQMLEKFEAELRRNAVSEENCRWLAGCGLTVDRMAAPGSTIQALQSRQADNRPSTQEEARNEAESQKDQEYKKAKNFCDNNQPDPFRKRYENRCAFLSDTINHAQKCVDLYNDWDHKWLPGRHDDKIASWDNRINNFKEEYNKSCTDKSDKFN